MFMKQIILITSYVVILILIILKICKGTINNDHQMNKEDLLIIFISNKKVIFKKSHIPTNFTTQEYSNHNPKHNTYQTNKKVTFKQSHISTNFTTQAYSNHNPNYNTYQTTN